MKVVNGSGWFSFEGDTMWVDYYEDTYLMDRGEMIAVRDKINQILELETDDD
jgi:nuclear transport factor 2 (NTF2) superfamily protein